MAIAPGTFFEEIGNFGVRNDHYIGDLASVNLAIGAGLVIAAQRPSWRVPVLWVAALWYALHALNHLADIGEADTELRGVVTTVLLAAGAAALGWLAVQAGRGEPAKARAPAARTEERPW
jgi:hypothetical protein